MARLSGYNAGPGRLTTTFPILAGLPGYFQGVVTLGRLLPDGVFRASEVLARHDETYMPPEVADALRRSGHWNPTQGAAPAAVTPFARSEATVASTSAGLRTSSFGRADGSPPRPRRGTPCLSKSVCTTSRDTPRLIASA